MIRQRNFRTLVYSLIYIQSRANLAQSKQRRFSRWLHNPRINPQRLYSPLIQAALKGWEELATLYLTAQGTEVVAQGKRRWVDPHWFRGSSYLKIGWNWVKTALIQGWELFHTLILPSSSDPEPVMASRRQYEKKRKF